MDTVKGVIAICLFVLMFGGLSYGSVWMGMSLGATFWQAVGYMGIAYAAVLVIGGIVAFFAWLGS